MMIRISILAVMIATGLVAADVVKKTPPRKTATQAAPSAPAGPPKGAVEVSPGTYRYVDAQGKVWNYRRTPFGWMKGEEKDMKPSAATPVAAAPQTRVFEDGDSVRFERQTPFGVQRWTRKKPDMTEEEKQIFERTIRPEQDAGSVRVPAQE
jgi:hypothetical protein